MLRESATPLELAPRLVAVQVPASEVRGPARRCCDALGRRRKRVRERRSRSSTGTVSSKEPDRMSRGSELIRANWSVLPRDSDASRSHPWTRTSSASICTASDASRYAIPPRRHAKEKARSAYLVLRHRRKMISRDRSLAISAVGGRWRRSPSTLIRTVPSSRGLVASRRRRCSERGGRRCGGRRDGGVAP